MGESVCATAYISWLLRRSFSGVDKQWQVPSVRCRTDLVSDEEQDSKQRIADARLGTTDRFLAIGVDARFTPGARRISRLYQEA